MSSQEGSLKASKKDLKAWQALVAREGENLEARSTLGQLLCSLQRPAEGSLHLRVVAEASPNNAKSWIRLARSLEQAGDSVSALAAWKQVLAIKPINEEARERLAEILVGLGRHDEALPHKRETTVGAADADASSKAARELELAAKPHEAVHAWGRVLELQPDSQEARTRYAALLVDLGRHKEASRQLRLLSDAAPENLGLALQWARCNDAAGKGAQAKEAWARVFECDGTLLEAHQRLSQLADKPAQALPHLLALASADPSAIRPCINLAIGLAAARDWPGAIETWRRVASLDPGNALARERLGELLFVQGAREEGVEQLRSASTVRDLLAVLSRGRSGEEDADLIEQSRRRLAPARPQGGWAVEGLAQRLAIEGGFDQALAALVAAFSDSPASALEQAVLSLCAAVAGGPAATTRPSSAPVVLISQIEHSGGSHLARLFDGHSQLRVYPQELRIGRPDKRTWPALDREARPRAWLTDLFDQAIARGIAEDTSFRFAMRTFYDTFMQLTRGAVSQRAALDAYLTAFFEAWQDSPGPQNARWFVGFCPRLALDDGSVARFFADYPDGRLISCVRNPAAWVASGRLHGDQYDTIDSALAQWTASVGAGLNLAEARPGQVHLVCFESLAANPEGEMQRLASDLGITFDVGLTQPTFAGSPIAPAADQAPLDDVLGPGELATIEQTAMPLYRRALAAIAGRASD